MRMKLFVLALIAPMFILTGCGGGGSSSSGASSNPPATQVTPIPVLPSSYENKMAALAVMGSQTLPQVGDAIAYADFFQDGTYSMVVHTLEYNVADPATASNFGHIYFYRKVNGVWQDATSQLLTDNVGCLHPRKAVVADFNGDGKPDVFFACHGFDASPYPGEQQRILLSQSDGTYLNSIVPITCYCHGASAADMNGNGFANILVADHTVATTPYFFINNKDGTFTQDMTRLPSLLNKQIWTAELIDFNNTGHYDVFLAGADPDSVGTYQILPTIFPNDGTDNFITTTPIEIPLASSAVSSSGSGVTLDVVVNSGNLYLLRTFAYNAVSVQKTPLGTLTSSEIYSHSGLYTGNTWFPWIGIYQNNLVTYNSSYNISIAM